MVVEAKIEIANGTEKFSIFQLRYFLPFFQLRYQPHLAGDLTLHALANGRQHRIIFAIMQSTNVFTNQPFCASPKQWRLQKRRQTKSVWCFRESPDFSFVFCLKDIWICLAGLLYLFEGNMGSICFWRRRAIGWGGREHILGLTLHKAANPDHNPDEWQQTSLMSKTTLVECCWKGIFFRMCNAVYSYQEMGGW